jgi:hypothetical protein
MAVEAIMAKAKKSGPKSGAIPPLKRVAVLASPEWVEWAEDGADFCRTDVSKLIDIALAEYLKSRGFAKEPPRRLP